MIQHEVLVPGPDGPIPTVLTHLGHAGPFPTVILFMDALGMREELRCMARRLAGRGHLVLLPNLFWRWGGPSFDPARLREHGPDPAMMRLNATYTHALGLADTAALLAFAAGHAAARDPVATVGFCMGGRHALAAAGTFPDRVAAMASLHGGLQVTDRADSAHLTLRHARAECYLGFADADPLTPDAERAMLAATAVAAGLRARLEVHAGTAHGFTFPERHCHAPAAAEKVWQRLFALLRRNLEASDGVAVG